jgi:pimeloyl-ACP methyl ester carboxylesterase
MADIVVAHGAWSAGWAWKKMRPLLRARGHVLWTPTYTGLGERSHLARPDIDLSHHVQDVVRVLEVEDLTNIVLIGHSYGGMVATGIADRAAERIARVIYLDAFVPRDGQSLATLTGQDADGAKAWRAACIDGWLAPPRPMPPDTAQADLDWAWPRRLHQPIASFLEPLRLTRGEMSLPRSYIYCTRAAEADGFRRFYDLARSEPGWSAHEIDASHNPHITCPEALAELIEAIIAEG